MPGTPDDKIGKKGRAGGKRVYKEEPKDYFSEVRGPYGSKKDDEGKSSGVKGAKRATGPGLLGDSLFSIGGRGPYRTLHDGCED